MTTAFITVWTDTEPSDVESHYLEIETDATMSRSDLGMAVHRAILAEQNKSIPMDERQPGDYWAMQQAERLSPDVLFVSMSHHQTINEKNSLQAVRAYLVRFHY